MQRVYQKQPHTVIKHEYSEYIWNKLQLALGLILKLPLQKAVELKKTEFFYCF